IWLDGHVEPPPDSPNINPTPDAAVPHDAAIVPPDAYVCIPQITELLLNPVFDLTPMGMGWVQQNIDNAYPLITDDDGVTEQSAPYKAWMGGWAGTDKSVSTLSDQLYQDVVVPANTTQLVLTGYYDVATSETIGLVYDVANVSLVQTNGVPIEGVL